MEEIELLAPCGDLEKLKTAITYGADAVYLGGEIGSLRAGAGNFSAEEMAAGIAYAHERGKKCHIALNIYPHNDDLKPLEDYVKRTALLGPDAFIVSDPGTIEMVKEYAPEAEIHLSTQANMTNYRTANFWYKQGVKRIVCAREMTLKEIRELRDHIPDDMEIEAFCHGAMCISYSGRCLLSNFMTQRDANRGACSHPCRWKYSLVEEKRPGEYYPIEEDDRGTYIMNSKDMCMLEHIDDMAKAGITSMKIEGRMKSMYYVAVTVGAYRKALDAYLGAPDTWQPDPTWMEELLKASHRQFTTGFYYDRPGGTEQNYRTSAYERSYTFSGVVRDFNEKTGEAVVEQRNKMVVGDPVEIFGPDVEPFVQIIESMKNEKGEPIDAAPHAQQIILIKTERPVKKGCMLRMKKGE